jgi:hypothetical protein
MAELQEDS